MKKVCTCAWIRCSVSWMTCPELWINLMQDRFEKIKPGIHPSTTALCHNVGTVIRSINIWNSPMSQKLLVTSCDKPELRERGPGHFIRRDVLTTFAIMLWSYFQAQKGSCAQCKCGFMCWFTKQHMKGREGEEIWRWDTWRWRDFYCSFQKVSALTPECH